MLQLTPLEKTVAGQEVFQMGRQEGLTKGELIGEIRLAQQLLKRPVSPKPALVKKSVKALKALFAQLEQELYRTTAHPVDSDAH